MPTVDDPATVESALTVAIPMQRTDAPLFEYAGHDRNDGMTNPLTGRPGAGGGSGRREVAVERGYGSRRGSRSPCVELERTHYCGQSTPWFWVVTGPIPL